MLAFPKTLTFADGLRLVQLKVTIWVREESSSGRQATPNKAFGFLGPAFRDQEVAGSNPFAPAHIGSGSGRQGETERVRTRGAIRAPESNWRSTLL